MPRNERIAVFDDDGTLWAEQPMFGQLAYALERVKALARQHPERKTTSPFSGVLAGDLEAAATSGEMSLLEFVKATHAGMTTREFAAIVSSWLAAANRPKLGRLYAASVSRPMLELLSFPRSNGSRTYIVSGGGVEMIRTLSEGGLRDRARAGRRLDGRHRVPRVERRAHDRPPAGGRLRLRRCR